MTTPITATFPALNFPKEVDYPTQEDWAAFSAAAELNYGILSGAWSDKSEEFKAQTNNLALEIQEIGENAFNAISLDTIEDLATYTGTGLVMVKDINRGGTFISKTATEIDPNTGNLYVINGGTIFAKLDGGFWVRQYSGAVNVKWFGAKGDGVTDDSIAFQSAVNYSSLIYLPKSIYLVDDIYISELGVRIFGDKLGSTVIISTNKIFTLSSSGYNQFFTLENVELRNALVAIDFTNLLNGSTNITLNDVKFNNCIKSCVCDDSYYNAGGNAWSGFVVFNECTFLGGEKQIYVNNGNLTTWTFNTCRFFSAQSAMYVDGDNTVIEGINFLNCSFDNFSDYPIKFLDRLDSKYNINIPSKTLTVDNCRFETQSGLYVSKNYSIDIFNCDLNCSEASANGIIYINGFNCIISGNRISNNSTSSNNVGIVLGVDSSNCYIEEDNVFSTKTRTKIINNGNANNIKLSILNNRNLGHKDYLIDRGALIYSFTSSNETFKIKTSSGQNDIINGTCNAVIGQFQITNLDSNALNTLKDRMTISINGIGEYRVWYINGTTAYLLDSILAGSVGTAVTISGIKANYKNIPQGTVAPLIYASFSGVGNITNLDSSKCSVIRIGIGIYRLTFLSSLIDGNYGAQVCADNMDKYTINSKSSSSFEFVTRDSDGAVVDLNNICVTIYGAANKYTI